MHHITDNIFVRKIKRMRKTESGRTIKSFEDEIEYYQYESEPSVRVHSSTRILASTNATASAAATAAVAAVFGKNDSDEYFSDYFRKSFGEKKPTEKRRRIMEESAAVVKKSEPMEDLYEQINNIDKIVKNMEESVKSVEQTMEDMDKPTSNLFRARRDSNAQNSADAARRKTRTSAELSESDFMSARRTKSDSVQYQPLTSAPTTQTHQLLASANLTVPPPCNETPTSSLSERIADDEVQNVFKNSHDSDNNSASEPNSVGEANEDEKLAKNQTKIEAEIKNKKLFNKLNALTETKMNSVADKPKSEDSPRELTLPRKVMYRGERINMQICGPVHILTANIHHHHHHSHPHQSAANYSVKDAPDADLVKSVEKCVDSLFDFGDIFKEIDTKLRHAQKREESRQSKALANSVQLTYSVSEPRTSLTKVERACSAPYLVQTNSYCHLAKVIDITQEWKIERQSQLGTIERIFPRDLSAEDENEESGFENTKFDTLKKRDANAIVATQPKINESQLLSLKKSTPNIAYPSTSHIDCVQPQPKYLHKTQSEAQKFRLIDNDQYSNLKDTIKNVEENLESARLFTKLSRNCEARLIEKAILDISERLSTQNEPVTRAQAEANEELLRTRLAEMILNIGSSPNSETAEPCNYAILKEPLNILKNKLNFLEQFVEEEDSIKEELNTITQLPVASRFSNIIQKREKVLKKRGEEIARMTPLISVVKQKLGSLENVVDVSARETKNSGRVTPYRERKTVHDLLVGINAEINTIHSLCRESNGVRSLNAVVDVLSRLCMGLDAILEALREYTISAAAKVKKPLGVEAEVEKMAVKPKIIDATHCNVDIRREEERESVMSFIISFGSGIRPITPKIHVKATVRQKTAKPSSRTSPVNLFRASNEQAASLWRTSSTKSKQSVEEFSRSGSISSQMQNNGKNSCLTIPTQRFSLRNTTHYSEPPRDETTSLNASLRKRDRSMNVARTFRVEPLCLHITLSAKSCASAKMAASREESSTDVSAARKLVNESNYLYAPYRSNAEGGGESSEFGDASSFVSDESPVFFLESRSQHPSKILNVGRRQPLSEVPNASRKRDPEEFSARKNESIKVEPRESAAKFSLNSRAERTKDDESLTSVSLLVPELLVNEDESASEALTASFPVLFRRASNVSKAASERETAILSDEDESNIVYVYNMRSTCTETFNLRRRNKRAVLNAIVFPEIRVEISATITTDTFEVDIERIAETGRQSVVMVSEEYYSKKVKITRQREPIDEILKQLRSNSDAQNGAEASSNDEDEDEDDDSSVYVETLAKLNVSIMARSARDSVFVHLEEIPWGEVTMDLTPNNHYLVAIPDALTTSNISQQTIGTTLSSDTTLNGGARETASIVSNIIVSENRDEARSLSHRSGGSLRSLATTDKTMSMTDVDIPAYVIKHGSTASITCEMNASVRRDATGSCGIEWYRGKERVDTTLPKYDRISHELIEVLVILKVDAEDGQLYSIKVNNEIYPVAYLIIEEANSEASKPPLAALAENGVSSSAQAAKYQHAFFISPPQTMFVMQGQTAIISCQMSVADVEMLWFKESARIQPGENDRIFFEKTPQAWYRIIIEDVDFIDQGVYYAVYNDKGTSINLIVEERIDEREVQVSSAETDDDELSDYLVPIGSTATIACELDNSSNMPATAANNAENSTSSASQHQLHWQLDNVDIATAEVGDMSAFGAAGDAFAAASLPATSMSSSRFERVQNENKHYLIIHNAQPSDSGVYSVLVNGVRFKVAQITIGQHGLLLKKPSQRSVLSTTAATAAVNNNNSETPQLSRRQQSSSSSSSYRIKRISNSSLHH